MPDPSTTFTYSITSDLGSFYDGWVTFDDPLKPSALNLASLDSLAAWLNGVMEYPYTIKITNDDDNSIFAQYKFLSLIHI